MPEIKDPRSRSTEVPPERPSQRSVLAATVLEPGLESTSRTANKIREGLGLAAHRYVLLRSDGGREEVIENVRIALLRALATTREAMVRIEIREKATRHLLCWAVAGSLRTDDEPDGVTPDAVVHAERRRLGIR